MSFNYSFSFGYLAQTSVINENGSYSPIGYPVGNHVHKNIQIKLYPRWYKHITIEWTVPVDWGNCLFDIYFCPTETGPFNKVNEIPVDGNYFLDISTQEYSKFNKGYYLVEAMLLDRNNVTIRSDPITWETYQNRWVQLRSIEIQRREFLLLTKFTGIKTYVFRKKTYGERCPECWSYTTEKVIKDNCKTCFGTSFKGGYFPPSSTLVQYEQSPSANIKTYFGVFEPNQIGAWTISFPELNPDDLIIRVGDWRVYRIANLVPTELQGNTVRQILQLTELAKPDIEYELVTKNLVEFPEEYR